jgi:hypothetical protein
MQSVETFEGFENCLHLETPHEVDPGIYPVQLSISIVYTTSGCRDEELPADTRQTGLSVLPETIGDLLASLYEPLPLRRCSHKKLENSLE